MNANINKQRFHLEYVDLIKVIYGVAICIEPQNHPYLALFTSENSDKISDIAGKKFWKRVQYDIDLAEQVGRAAALLIGSFNDSTFLKPQFMRLDSAKRSAFVDPFAEKGCEKILSCAAQRCKKELWYCFRHFSKAMDLGEHFLNQTVARDDEDNFLIPGNRGLIPTGIGFNRKEITAFLNQNGIKHSLTVPRYREKRRLKASTSGANRAKNLTMKRKKTRLKH